MNQEPGNTTPMLDAETAQIFARHAQIAEVPAGTRLFGHGMPCERFVLVQDGTVRVQTVSENGRMIVLYRVGPGEICAMTTSCLLGDVPYAAEGIAETNCRIAILPRAIFEQQIAQSAAFRRFVFAMHGRRLVELMQLFEDVTFQRIDVRLAKYLLGSAQTALHITHQDIATELGSAREVISRCLKEFERRALVCLHRGSIEILDRGALRQLAGRM